MLFIESSVFTKLLSKYLTDEEYSAFQHMLLSNPDIGDIIRGTSGLRKVRWSAAGTGKRGGTRVIYYWRVREDQILLLTIYCKSEVSDLTPIERRALSRLVKEWDHG